MATKQAKSKLKRMTAEGERTYKQFAKLDRQRLRAKKKMDDLKKQLDKLEPDLKREFRGASRRLLSNGVVVERIVTPVEALCVTEEHEIGDILRAAYEKVRYEEKDR